MMYVYHATVLGRCVCNKHNWQPIVINDDVICMSRELLGENCRTPCFLGVVPPLLLVGRLKGQKFVVSYPDPTPRREGCGDIQAFSWLCCVSSHMTLITCLHHLLLHSRSHEQLISAFVIPISCQSLCSYVRVAKGYLCLHCQAGAVRSCDQCHVAADTAQPRKRSNVTRPFPLRGGVWARD